MAIAQLDLTNRPAGHNNIFFLIGFRNRFIAIVEWARTHVRNDRGARLLAGYVQPLLERGEKTENRDRML